MLPEPRSEVYYRYYKLGGGAVQVAANLCFSKNLETGRSAHLGRSWSHRVSCKAGAGTAEERAALWELQPELLWTLIKITGEEEERKTYFGFSSQSPSQCSLVKPQKNQFGRDLGNVVCISHLSLVCDIEQSMGKRAGGEPEWKVNWSNLKASFLDNFKLTWPQRRQ